MMNCHEIEAQDVIERYLSGDLSEAEQQTFEDHYFACAECFEQLSFARALRTRREGSRIKVRTASPFSNRLRLVLVPIAALILVAVLGAIYWKLPNSHVESVPQGLDTAGNVASPANTHPEKEEVLLSQLARVEPPPYTPKRLRGTEDEFRVEFDSAMSHYMKGDYRATIEGLQKAARLSPKAEDANFYLGACYLLTGQLEKAIAALQKAASPNAPDYAEQAHFYLAKTYLQMHNVASAQSELDSTLRFHGVREREARKFKEELGKLQ